MTITTTHVGSLPRSRSESQWMQVLVSVDGKTLPSSIKNIDAIDVQIKTTLFDIWTSKDIGNIRTRLPTTCQRNNPLVFSICEQERIRQWIGGQVNSPANQFAAERRTHNLIDSSVQLRRKKDDGSV